jgi:hypothetical protein
MENISDHISYIEATSSQTASRKGIDNTPTEEQLANGKLVAEKCFEPLRRNFGPLRVSSFFRCKELNKAIGGSSTSQHCSMEAIDIQETDGTNSSLFIWAKTNLKFDQLIWEYPDPKTHEPAWVHISYTEKRPLRNECLVCIAGKYVPYDLWFKNLTINNN